MAHGRHLFPNNTQPKAGLSGFFNRMENQTFRVEDVNENFEISHDATELNINIVAASFGSVSSIIGSIIGAGLATSGGTLGISALVAGVAASVLLIINKLGFLNSCSKATYDPETTQQHCNRITDNVKGNYANISNQQATSVLQDDKVVSEMNNLLRKLACYRVFYRQEATIDWKSSCSRDNVQKLNEYTDRLEGNLLAKIRKLDLFYEIDLWEEEIDFSQGAGLEIATEECKIGSGVGKGMRWVVYLSRKQGEENTLVPFVDFARSDLTTLEVVNAILSSQGIDYLRSEGKKINQQWLGRGCAEIYESGKVICKKINADDIARQNIATQTPNVVVADDLTAVFEKYYSNDPTYTLEKVIEIVQKHSDTQISDAFKTNYFNYQRFGQKKDFVCWLASQRATAFEFVKSMLLYKNATTTAQRTEVTKFIDSICVGYVAPSSGNGNTQTANNQPTNPRNPAQGTTPTPNVGNLSPSSGNGNTQTADNQPTNPRNPAQGTTTTPNVPVTPPSSGTNTTPNVGNLSPSSGNGSTQTADNQPKTDVPTQTTPTTPSVPTSPATNVPSTGKKSGSWWWLLLVAFGVYTLSENNKKTKK